MKKNIFILFGMLLLCYCESGLDHLDIKNNNLKQPNDSTIVFMNVNNDFGFHIEVYYSINEIYTLTNGYFDTDVCWGFNKKSIYFTKDTGEDQKLQIWKMKYDGSQKTPISPVDLYCSSPNISPDGSMLAFSAEIGGYNQIIITDTSGNTWNQITNVSMMSDSIVFFLPSWVSDNEHILFTYQTFSGYHFSSPHLAMININTKEISYFVKIDSLYPHHAEWSPTRDEIVFVGMGIPGDQIYRMNSDQTNILKLTDSYLTYAPDWSSTGDRIVFSQRTESLDSRDEIWIMDRDGSNKRKVISKYDFCDLPDW